MDNLDEIRERFLEGSDEEFELEWDAIQERISTSNEGINPDLMKTIKRIFREGYIIGHYRGCRKTVAVIRAMKDEYDGNDVPTGTA